MKNFFIKTIVLFSLASSSITFAAEEKSEGEKSNGKSNSENVDLYELNQDESNLLDRTTLSYRANELKDMYAQTAIHNSISFDRSYMLDEPLTLEEALDFNHPYLNIMLTDLTEVDRDAIIESIKTDAAKNQRLKSIMLTAMKFSTDAALYKRTRTYHSRLLGEYYPKLSQIFPFHFLTLENGKIKPAVIEEIGFSNVIALSEGFDELVDEGLEEAEN